MLYSFVIECGAMTSCLYYYSYIIQEAFCYLLEKPNKFDPFGQKESAHLIYHTIAPLKVLVMGVNFILPF